MKKALITGITGQDGSYLAELLLDKGYEVHGLIRRSSYPNTKRIDHIFNDLYLHYGDITDPISISNIINKIQPDEIYNLCAMSHVQISFELPQYVSQVDAIGTLNVLESVKNYSPHSKIYQASTSELYGGISNNMPLTGYNETSPFYPRSPYGVAKLYGYWICKNYKEAYNMFISNGILFNHGSPRRGINFIEKKIVDGLYNIKTNKQECLKIGNLYAKRDIGYAKEYVNGMWNMLQHGQPDDFILATNRTYSIKEMIDTTAKLLDLKLEWSNSGMHEIGIDKLHNKTIIKIDPRYFRPTEVDVLLGDYTKAKNILDWKPTTYLPELLQLILNEKQQHN